MLHLILSTHLSLIYIIQIFIAKKINYIFFFILIFFGVIYEY